MPTRVADLRSRLSTVDQADDAFRRYALLCKKIHAADARLEEQLARRMETHRQRTAEDRDQAESLKADIVAFVDNHRELFQKPRTRKLEQGKYGLQTASELLVADEDALFNALMELGYEDCFETVRKPVKKRLRERIKNGEAIPHCTIREGDTVLCTPSRAFIEADESPDDHGD